MNKDTVEALSELGKSLAPAPKYEGGWVKDAVLLSQKIAAESLHQGMLIGLRKAAEMCEAKAELHAGYLPKGHYYASGDLHQAATCGRRDEAADLARSIQVVMAALEKESK